jgi:hypothetical protein
MFRHVLTSASGILHGDAAFKRGKLTRPGKRLLPRIVGALHLPPSQANCQIARDAILRFPNEITNGRQEGGMLKRLPALLALPALMVIASTTAFADKTTLAVSTQLGNNYLPRL